MKKEDILEKLVNLDGVSGNEDEVRRFILNETKKHLKDIKVDKMGNVVAIKKGKRPSIMLLSHMDEIGLMIRSIDKKGKMYISTIGGIEPSILLGQRVRVHGGKEFIKGIVTMDEILNGSELSKKIKIEDLYIYTGLDKKGLEKRNVRIGSYVSFGASSHFATLGGTNHVISGKALDDRIGNYIMLQLMKNLKSDNEVIFVFTVQEEVGLYGAKASVFNLDPDYAIAIDVTGHDDDHGTVLLGRGPVITIKDAELIGNKCLNDHLEKTANKFKIPYQPEVSEFGTTDATSIFAAKGGIPAGVIGVSVANLHTTISMASRDDVENTVKLLKEFLRKPPRECWR
jgi:tetrahedral aminopeptidase